MYLNLSDFDHLRDDQTVRFREEWVNGLEVVIIAYMISNDDLWAKPYGVECRGSTFDKETGELISLPFEKFFNVNEKAHTQANIVQEYDVNFILDKRDGSMITPAIVNGMVCLKTKKSFYSDVANDANKNITRPVLDMCRDALTAHYCPIFEFTSPDNKVVLDYGVEPHFVLLAIRDMVTGSYFSHDECVLFAGRYGVDVVERVTDMETVGDCLRAVDYRDGIEGWVIYTDEGRFKVKTKWYIDRHHLIDIRERDIARFVLDDVLDDLIPNLLEAEADMDIIRRIEHDVARDLAEIMNRVEDLGEQAKAYEGAVRAQWVAANAGELAKFVHRAARYHENSDEAFREFYRQRYIDKFSLRSIGNPNFRGEEAE
jgi:RNA ligase